MRRTTCIIQIAICLLVIIGCHKPTPHEAVRSAAEKYYGYLIEGNVDEYVAAIHDYDEFPEEYRSQLRDMIAQYLANEEKSHGGLIAARALNDTIIDSIQAHVFMEVQFGDSTLEQVFLPLVLTDKGWKMK